MTTVNTTTMSPVDYTSTVMTRIPPATVAYYRMLARNAADNADVRWTWTTPDWTGAHAPEAILASSAVIL